MVSKGVGAAALCMASLAVLGQTPHPALKAAHRVFTAAELPTHLVLPVVK